MRLSHHADGSATYAALWPRASAARYSRNTIGTAWRRASTWRRAATQGAPGYPAPSRTRSHLDVAAMLALECALQLVECRILDLTDPLARQMVLITDLAERALLVVAEPEALGQHVGLDR